MTVDRRHLSGWSTRQARFTVLVGVTVAVATTSFLLPSIPQEPTYHNFSDQRTLLGIPNCLNVISNAVLAVVGVLGLVFLLRNRTRDTGSFSNRLERWPYEVFFLAIVLASMGSAYYHLAPNNERLVWDRLPMALAFMAFLAAIIMERINLSAGLWSLAPLLGLGIGSIAYWHLTEQRGVGDLRLYGVVQFYPMLAIPLMMWLFPPRYTRGAELVGALVFYASAKAFEALDALIFSAGHIVSGHTLKHVSAAMAAYWILRVLRKRKILVCHFNV